MVSYFFSEIKNS